MNPLETSLPPIGSPEEARLFLDDPVGCMAQLNRDYGDAVVFQNGGTNLVFAFGMDHNREILTRPDDFHIVSCFPGPRNSPQRRFCSGLFSMNGEQHQKHRRLLTPPFRKEELPIQLAPIQRIIDARVANWQVGQVVDLAQEMKEITLQLTTNLLFGLDELGGAHEVEKLFEEWLNLNHAVSFSVWLPCEMPKENYAKLLDTATRLEEQLKLLLHQKHSGGDDANDLLAILMRAKQSGAISETEVIGQTVTLYNAAYHTTAYALTWNLFLLAQHPETARQLLDELDDQLGDATPTAPVLEKLPVLDRAIKEGLRLLPPVVYMPRLTPNATRLGSYNLPASTFVMPSPYVTHHQESIFPEANAYRPERWLSPPPHYGYIPFGGGNRLCLGAPLAMMIVRATIAAIWPRFRLSVVPGSRIERTGTLTMEAKFGIPVQLHRQDRRFAASQVVGNIHEMVDLPVALPRRIAA